MKRKYTVKGKSPEKLLSRLLNSGLDFSEPKKEEEGISFVSSSFKQSQIKKIFEDVSSAPTGLMSELLFLKKRKGLIFGAIFSLFLIYLSTFYVWSVKIEGNEEITDSEIINLLYECGFYEGVRKSEIDVNELQNEVLSRCHELSFLSVNIHGMVADVVVHERVTVKKPTDRNVPYNLVADIDGVIVSSLILDGQVMFKEGDTVTKGELLVSGIIDSTSEGFRLRQAEGKVFARTSRTLEFICPLEEYEKKVIKTDEKVRMRILGHSIGRGVKDDSGNFEIERKEEKIKILGITLPLTLERLKAVYYTDKKSILSEEEAKDKLLSDYKKYISTELDSSSILKEEFNFTLNSDSVTLTAEVSAIENIAVKEKINTK